MISLQSKQTIPSKVAPGVSFTVRTLNKIQRAKRDFPIADAVVRFHNTCDEWRSLLPAKWQELQESRVKVAGLAVDLEAIAAGSDAAVAKQSELEEASKALAAVNGAIVDPPENIKRRAALDYIAGLIKDEHLKPATIRAGLVSIEGLTIDGKSATPEALIGAGDFDELIDEIYAACEAVSGLNDEARKNLESPTTSTGPVATDLTTSGADPAKN